jgi:uncharacterized protein (DUF362 family)
MNRREFCRKMGAASGAIVLAPLIKACAPEADAPAGAVSSALTQEPIPTRTLPPTMTPYPTATPGAEAVATATGTSEPTATVYHDSIAEIGRTRIALVQTSDRAAGVQRAIELLGVNPVRGNRVLLKPNYNSADPPPASTHPESLRGLILALNNMGAHSVTVGERSGMGNTRPVLEKVGFYGLAEEFGFDTVVFDELEEGAWTVRRSTDFYWPEGFAVPKMLLDADCVVQICNLKTHKYGGHFTMALKNSVGFVPWTIDGSYNYMDVLHNSSNQRRMIADINSAYQPSLIVLDAVEAFVDGGPATGKKVSPGLILAGTDPVAIDAVGVAILRLYGTTPEVSRGKVFDQEQIARAVELGLGVDSASKIDFNLNQTEDQPLANQILSVLRA